MQENATTSTRPAPLAHGRRNPLDRRRLDDRAPRKTFSVGQMTELHHEITRRVLIGQKNVDIANALGCTPQTVSNVRNSPIVKHRLSQLAHERDIEAVDFARSVNERVGQAFKIVDEALFDETGETPLMMRLREANNMLDRKEKLDGVGQRSFHVHAHLNASDIAELKKRALEAGIASGCIDISNDAS